jgi:hypothetical protein
MRHLTRYLIVVGVALAAGPTAACIKGLGPDAQDPREFVAQARAATERFKDQAVATTEGYVKVGPDFPAMGEHWVNGELVVRGEFDAARPAILTYATIRGERTLTGAVYAIAVGPGQKVPDALPGAHWHGPRGIHRRGEPAVRARRDDRGRQRAVGGDARLGVGRQSGRDVRDQ